MNKSKQTSSSQKCSPCVVGSSSSFNLHADKPPYRLRIRNFKNGEAILHVTRVGKDMVKSSEEGGKKRGRKKGKKLVQSELTRHAKRSIRNGAWICRRKSRKKKCSRSKNRCSFITITFRRLLPNNPEEAKHLLDNLLERMRRKFGARFNYLWVAEMQNGKWLNGRGSYRITNESAIHFHILTTAFIPKGWLNKAWNEVVANYFLKENRITPMEYQQWMNELDNSERGKSVKGTSEFLLLPNIKGVNKPEAYLAKYLSKGGGQIQGHLWGSDQELKALVKPLLTELAFPDMYSAEQFIMRLYSMMKEAGKFMFSWLDYDSHFGFWTSDGYLALRFYYQQYELKFQNSS